VILAPLANAAVKLRPRTFAWWLPWPNGDNRLRKDLPVNNVDELCAGAQVTTDKR
jgi:hypothetical protein